MQQRVIHIHQNRPQRDRNGPRTPHPRGIRYPLWPPPHDHSAKQGNNPQNHQRMKRLLNLLRNLLKRGCLRIFPKPHFCVLLSLSLLTVYSCSTSRHVSGLVEHTSTDTLSLSQVQYDSIYVSKTACSTARATPSISVTFQSSTATASTATPSIGRFYKLALRRFCSISEQISW